MEQPGNEPKRARNAITMCGLTPSGEPGPMNTRVALLIIVAAIYARAWDGDAAHQSDSQAAGVARLDSTANRTGHCRGAWPRQVTAGGFRGCFGSSTAS